MMMPYNSNRNNNNSNRVVGTTDSDRGVIVNCILNSALKSQKLNICSINIQSIMSGTKIDELKLIFENSRASIITVTETWLTSRISSDKLKVKGYKMYRNDRFSKRGGGILVYVSEHISCSLIEKSSGISQTEFLLIELFLQNEKILLASLYNPPRINCLQVFEDMFRKYMVKYDDFIIAGDLNKDYLTDSSLHDLFLSYNIQNHITEPTHFQGTSATLIDYIASCKSEKLLISNQVNYSGFSKHDIVFCSLDYDLGQSVSKKIQYRNYSRFDVDSLSFAIQAINWNQYFMLVDPNDMLEFLNDNLSQVHDTIFPLRSKSDHQLPCPWFNDVVRQAMIDRDMAYSLWIRTRQQSDFTVFKKLRNKCRTVFRTAKNLFIDRSIHPGLPTKVLWKRLGDFGIKKNGCVSHSDFSPNVINEHFVNSVNSDITILPLEVNQTCLYHLGFRRLIQLKLKILFSLLNLMQQVLMVYL